MLGHSSGLHAYVEKVSPDCMFMHCMIHREALASKTLGSELMKVLKQVVKLVNAVKSSALNTRLFRRFCEQMDSDHYNLLFHTEVRWLSKSNVLKSGSLPCVSSWGSFLCSKRRAGKRFARRCGITGLPYGYFWKTEWINTFLARIWQNNQLHRCTLSISGETWTLGKKDDNEQNWNVSYPGWITWRHRGCASQWQYQIEDYQQPLLSSWWICKLFPRHSKRWFGIRQKSVPGGRHQGVVRLNWVAKWVAC